ncbi:hypothetical protein [Bifidobacterium breve]|uniref:hypothetical protein n=1 Tax=Bifidobacterium breve TaxID=1685 RepID=UPI0034A37488
MIRTCAPGSPAATRPIRAGNADIDVIFLKGRTVWLLDAKRYAPYREDGWIMPPGTSDDTGPYLLRATNGGPDIHASANMRLACDAIRRLCPKADVRAAILLARTGKGVYGTYGETEWPGRIPVRNADAWIRDTLIPALAGLPAADMRIAARLDPLVKA